MRNPGLVAFSITTLVLVPAAIHQLMAGKEQIEKLASPDTSEIRVGAARVAVSLDRYMLDPGDPLTIHLAVSDAPGRKLELGVLVMGSNGTEGDRVPSPPTGVAFKTVSMAVKDGVASTDVVVPLKGAVQRAYSPFGHYTVLVGPPAAIAKLERLRKNAHYVGDEDEGIPMLNKSGERFMSFYRDVRYAGDEEEAAGDGSGATPKATPKAAPVYSPTTIARVEAHTRPLSTAIGLAVPPTATRGDAFTVTVRLTNPGRKAMHGLEVKLAEHLGFDVDYAPEHEPRLTIAKEMEAIDLAPNETKEVAFRVTGGSEGVVGLYAQATCPYSEDETACKDVQALALGAFDAIEIRAREKAAPAVVAR